MKNIVIVDEHIIFRESLKFFIENENLGNVIALVDNSLTLKDIFQHFEVDLVILDISSSNIVTFDFIVDMFVCKPNVNTLILSMSNSKEVVSKMKFLGVGGFVQISAGKNELQSAISTVLTGGSYFASDIVH